MTAPRFDLFGIGNAIVDVLARAEDDFLVAEGMAKSSMALIDEARAQALYGKIGQTVLVSGGSAANTCVGAAMLGARVAFAGKVRDDELGRSFIHDIRAVGVAFDVPPATDGLSTASCTILVTPDGERTMNTFLGASQNLGPDDIDASQVADSAITYLEGYLWDPPAAKAAFRRAAEIAHGAGRTVALSLSDLFCVDRHRPEFLELLKSGTVDVVFANEAEAKSLAETSDLKSAIGVLRDLARIAVITRSEDGAVITEGSTIVAVPAHPIERIVDATGAGDLYAAGFLTGLGRGFSLEDCARLGALAAAEVIQHMGARPQADLKALAAEEGIALAPEVT